MWLKELIYFPETFFVAVRTREGSMKGHVLKQDQVCMPRCDGHLCITTRSEVNLALLGI